VSNTSPSNSSDKTVTATCGAGDVVLGGGHILSGSVNLAAQSSYPSSSTVWSVTGVETDNVGGNWTVTAYAICG
jgi:hypothetical protein